MFSKVEKSIAPSSPTGTESSQLMLRGALSGRGDRSSMLVAKGTSQRRGKNLRTESDRAATLRSIRENLVCGAVARFVQNVTTYPIDTVKTRVQVSKFLNTGESGRFSRIRAAVRKGSLYRGLPLSLLGNVPYGMITFGL